MDQAKALLYVQMNPPDDAQGARAFHEWYEDHMAVRREMPGFFNAQRYQNVDPEGSRHMAWYDLADASALSSQEYLALRDREAVNPRDIKIRGSVPFVERRLYRCIDTDEPWAAPREGVAPFVMSVALEPPPGQIDDFHAWYREEHSPMLMEARGWRRIRRYEQLEGNGPRFMALHELDSLGGFDTKEYEAALATPWRIKVTGAVVRRERLRWELIQGA
jgi:hypothetical protein